MHATVWVLKIRKINENILLHFKMLTIVNEMIFEEV